jgi:uridine kinase
VSDASSAPEPPAALRARVVLLAGPSGSGKSHLAARSGLPTICLDDFYKDGDDPTLPVSELGIADWDHVDAWDGQRALACLRELAIDGVTWVPVYDISQDRATGTQRIELGDAPLFVAEGIFAAHLVRDCRELDILADAVCVVHRPAVTFWRRLVRDLRESRKAPWLLIRRGLALWRQEPRIVAGHVALGAEPVQAADTLHRLQSIVTAQALDPDDEVAA